MKTIKEIYERAYRTHNGMSIKVPTSDDWDRLMRALEAEGWALWQGGSKPTVHNKWNRFLENTVINIGLECKLTYGSRPYYTEIYYVDDIFNEIDASDEISDISDVSLLYEG